VVAAIALYPFARIVKNHGGHIECSGQPGAGTTFSIFFPTVDQDVKPEEPARRVAPLEGGTETILLVDDEEPLRELGEDTLSAFGYSVLTAADGEKGLEIYRQDPERIDLVILDLIMPGMGGRRCLEKLLETNPEAKVIIASGYSDSGPVKETLEAGARSFIGKPYEISQILEIVRDVLDES
jgi:CheY-like chemotaxis protein